MVSIFFLVCLQLLTGHSCAAAATPDPAAEAFLQWSSASTERLADGRIKLVLTLESSRPGLVLDNPVALYRLTRSGRFNRPPVPEDAGIYSLNWEQSTDGLKLVIFSGEYGRATVFARAEIEGRTHYAQTAFNLYGRSKSGALPEPHRLSQAPDWPEFLLNSNDRLYWPQTGQEFTFKLVRGENASANSLVVWDGGRRVAEVQPGLAGCQYRPEHDPILNRAGDLASKPLVFVARNADGGSTAFTLFIHRSRRAGWDLSAGLWLFTASVLVSGILAWLARRRFSVCA